MQYYKSIFIDIYYIFIDWEFGSFGFEIRKNSRILYFFKIRWNSVKFGRL